MQKTNRKAIILIWAIFLSLIISVIFIGISTKINKNIKNSSNLTDKLRTQNELKNILNSKIINGDYGKYILDNGEELIFEDLNEKKINIKKEETIKIKFEQTNEVTITGSILYYSGTTSTGIINNNITLSTGSGFLYLTNLGGYSQIDISSTGSIIEKYINYKIIKNIGNKYIIKSRGKIKNF